MNESVNTRRTNRDSRAGAMPALQIFHIVENKYKYDVLVPRSFSTANPLALKVDGHSVCAGVRRSDGLKRSIQRDEERY